MNPKQKSHLKRILIHNHDLVYKDKNGDMYLSSGIGRWINSLSPHFEKIGLLFHESTHKTPKQNTKLDSKNIKLITLGPPGYYFDYFKRINRIKKICRELKSWDVLLIRGITPRQSAILKNVNVKIKAYMLVRSMIQKRTWSISPIKIIAITANIIREYQFRKIINSDILLISNSVKNIDDMKKISKNKGNYISTNIIMKDELSHLSIKEFSSPIQLLFVGRLNYMKGLRELIGALKELNKNEDKYHLNIVADQLEPIYSELRRYSLHKQVDDNITWHGFIPFGDKLFSMYKNSDIFILPSYTEGFPRVLWEAASNSCSMVVSDVGGISDILVDKENALLIKPKSINSIVESVKMLSDIKLRTRIVTNAHEIACNNTIENSSLKLAKLLNNYNYEN